MIFRIDGTLRTFQPIDRLLPCPTAMDTSRHNATARVRYVLNVVPRRGRRLRLQLGESAEALKRLVASHSVRLEVSSKCQLKCPACPTAKGLNRKGIVGWGNLTLKAFEQFVNANPRIGHIEISNWGEMFLNPRLDEIVKYAYKAGIKLTANNGVNFNSVSDDTLETLVKYRFRRLTISLDGATPATYRDYRRGGELDHVIGNIGKLNQYKRRYGSRYPILTWQFVIFGHNEHELARARSLARELGMNFLPKFNTEVWGTQYSPVKNRELVKAESPFGVASVADFRQEYGREYLIPCQELWLSPQINWDGKLLGCCVNVWGDYGNVFESGLDGCLTGEKYTYAQKMLLGEVEERGDIPCAQCSFYQNHALKKLLEGTFTRRIARRLLSAKVTGGDHGKLTAVGRIRVRVFEAGQGASARIRKFRAWLLTSSETPSSTPTAR